MCSVHICTVVTSTTGQSDSSDSVAAIGGAVGGTILFVVITTLVIMMLWCVRVSHKKKAYFIDNNSLKEVVPNVVELESNITTAKVKRSEVELDCVQTNDHTSHPDTDSEAAIKMTANPSYDLTRNTNIKMTSNPSYGVTNKPLYSGDYDYVFDHSIQYPNINNTPIQDLLHRNTTPDVAIKMDANPSYGLTVQDAKTNKDGIKNDYDYIDDGLIQHPSLLTVSTNQYNVTAETKEAEYGVVNQPMSDSFSASTLGRMIREDKSGTGIWPISEDVTKYEDNNDM